LENCKSITLTLFQIAWLKVRNLQLRVLAGSVMLGQELDHDHSGTSSGTNNGLGGQGDIKPVYQILGDLRTQLADHLESCRQCFSQDTKVAAAAENY